MSAYASTTRSINCQITMLEEMGIDDKHLINTSKVLRGNKIRSNDYAKILQLKYRNCSPTRIAEDQINHPINQFTLKYRPFDDINQKQDLHRFIQLQRQKKSREIIKRIKLFSHKKLQSSGDQSLKQQKKQFNIDRATTTHQTKRSSRKNRTQNNLQKTLSYQIRNATADNNKRKDKKLVQFKSQNIGVRMNEYLNIVLQKRQTQDNNLIEQYIKQQNDLLNLKQVQNKDEKALTNIKKINTFYRQMKKTIRNKPENGQKNFKSLQSSQLVRSLLKKTARPQSNISSSHKIDESHLYSIDLLDKQYMSKMQKLKEGSTKITLYKTIQNFSTPSTKR